MLPYTAQGLIEWVFTQAIITLPVEFRPDLLRKKLFCIQWHLQFFFSKNNEHLTKIFHTLITLFLVTNLHPVLWQVIITLLNQGFQSYLNSNLKIVRFFRSLDHIQPTDFFSCFLHCNIKGSQVENFWDLKPVVINFGCQRVNSDRRGSCTFLCHIAILKIEQFSVF